jgi:cytochrome c oxidase cbb3-type subunit 3
VRTPALLLSALALLAACEREEREFRGDPGTTGSEEEISMSSVSAGVAPPIATPSGRGREYEENAYHIAQGQRFYGWFNCNGCHANGGGSSGPALMDDRWIYGAAIENIVQTIREGRPNGMPSFRGKIPDEQIWQIAAYVRSMPRYAPKAASPGRRDDMHPGMAEQRRPVASPPGGGTTPPAAEMPQ